MQKIDNLQSPTTGGLTISRELDQVSEDAQVPAETSVVDLRVVGLCGVAIGLGATVSVAALALVRMIALFTNLAFYQRWSFEEVSPAGNSLGLWVIVVPMIGGLIVGLMARFGSQAIRGHGIPETMEQVLANHSRIPARMTFLKPLRPPLPSAPAVPSERRARSSRRGVRLARCSGNSCRPRRRNARRYWPRGRRPA